MYVVKFIVYVQIKNKGHMSFFITEDNKDHNGINDQNPKNDQI